MDPNRHLRYSEYLDYAAQTRVALFDEFGFGMDKIAQLELGPILFREEVKYLKEVHIQDELTIHSSLKWMYRDGSRWSFVHHMAKDDNIAVAELTVDDAWLNLKARKLGMPSDELLKVMEKMPRTTAFQWINHKKSS